jgi:hypothetical protein
MDELETIWQKAQKLASGADNAEVMQKALETARIARELQSKEKERKWLRSAQSWATIVTSSTAAFAVVISLITLAIQLYQFRKTSEMQQEQFKKTTKQQEDAAATSQWRDALKNVSFKDDSSVLSSTIQMQSFFSYRPYSAQSRSVASMLLPYVTSGAGFDAAVDQMRATSDKLTQKDMVAVAQSIVDEDWDLYSLARKPGSNKTFADFIEDPTGMIAEGTQFLPTGPAKLDQAQNEAEKDRWFNPLKRALTCSYNADSISAELARFWHDNKESHPGPAHLGLAGIVLENADLTDVDFSNATLQEVTINKCNLKGANFSNAKLDHAVVTNISDFSQSKWDGAEWWKADRLDCNLAHYLSKAVQVSPKWAKKSAQLVRNCVGVTASLERSQ